MRARGDVCACESRAQKHGGLVGGWWKPRGGAVTRYRFAVKVAAMSTVVHYGVRHVVKFNKEILHSLLAVFSQIWFLNFYLLVKNFCEC